MQIREPSAFISGGRVTRVLQGRRINGVKKKESMKAGLWSLTRLMEAGQIGLVVAV